MNSDPCGSRPPAFRLPEATRLGSIQLQVADLERSVEWYQRVLGFRTVESRGADAALATSGAGDVLLRLREVSGSRPVPREGRIGLYHFAILLPDRAHLGALLPHLARHGVRPGASDHHVSEALYLSDPDGLGIEVYADRPRDRWICRDGQLHMTTEPLDLADLQAAAAPTWQGLPDGTAIGHIHLFVTDLDDASAFYHQALGFDRMVWNYPGALFLAAGGYHHHLGTNTWARHATAAGPGDARLLEWTVRLPSQGDVAAAAAALDTAGFPTSTHGEDHGVVDPWGNRVRLSSSA